MSWSVFSSNEAIRSCSSPTAAIAVRISAKSEEALHRSQSPLSRQFSFELLLDPIYDRLNRIQVGYFFR